MKLGPINEFFSIIWRLWETNQLSLSLLLLPLSLLLCLVTKKLVWKYSKLFCSFFLHIFWEEWILRAHRCKYTGERASEIVSWITRLGPSLEEMVFEYNASRKQHLSTNWWCEWNASENNVPQQCLWTECLLIISEKQFGWKNPNYLGTTPEDEQIGASGWGRSNCRLLNLRKGLIILDLF